MARRAFAEVRECQLVLAGYFCIDLELAPVPVVSRVHDLAVRILHIHVHGELLRLIVFYFGREVALQSLAGLLNVKEERLLVVRFQREPELVVCVEIFLVWKKHVRGVNGSFLLCALIDLADFAHLLGVVLSPAPSPRAISLLLPGSRCEHDQQVN